MPHNERYLSHERFDQIASGDHAADAALASTGAETPAAERAKVVFDAAQQEKVNQLIRDAQGRAAAELRAQLATTQAQLDSMRTAHKADDGTQLLAAELAASRAESKALREAQNESTISSALLAACAAERFVDPQLGCQLLKSSVKLIDGKPVPVDETGMPLTNSSMDNMSVEEFVRDYAKSKPFLIASDVRAGLGSSEARGKEPQPGLEKLFGKNSDSALANKLALFDRPKYMRLRAQAREKGLI